MQKMISGLSIIALLMPMSAIAQAPGLTRIGAAGAVAGSVRATAASQGAVGRVIGSGQPLFLNDAVSTDAQGRLQVLLLDETVFTIGPNSSMVLDTFVYDPASGAGKLSARILKGVFRFVTGRIARKRPSEMEVKMPVGVIGIRGTMVGGEVNENGSTVVLLGPGAGNNAGERIGQAKVSSNGKNVSLLQPGSAVNVGKDGALGPVFKISPDKLNAMMGSLGNKQGNDKGNNGKAGKLGPGSDESGQNTGKGLGNANDADNDTSAFKGASNLLNTINGTLIVDGPATWEQARTITFGQGMYNGSGAFYQTLCAGSPCMVAGTANFTLAIDFGARTVGGSGTGSFVSWSAGTMTSSGNQQIAGNIGGNPVSFASLTGAAVFTPTIGTGTCAGCSGTVTILNKNGTVAGGAQFAIQQNMGGGNLGSGTVVGTR